MHRLSFRLCTFLIVMTMAGTQAAHALEPADKETATAAINSFDESLLATMKQGRQLGYEGRFNQLSPIVDKLFDLGLMTRLLVGPQWNDMSAETQAALVERFRRFTIGSYASRFDDYHGEKFLTDGEPMEQRDSVMVPTELVPKNGQPVKLNYLLHQTGKGWQVIDIFLNGTISELATQRSEFQSVLSQNGVDALITQLDKKTADLATSAVAMPAQQQ